jgi:DNA polymerase
MSLVAMRAASKEIIVWVPVGRGPRNLSELTVDDLWPQGHDRGDYKLTFCVQKAPPIKLLQWVHLGYTFVAHNAAGFDALAWKMLVEDRFLPDELHGMTWYDTLPCAKAGGFPGDLDTLGQMLVGKGKDDGKAALKLLYGAKVVDGDVFYPLGTKPLWQLMLRYNVADVLLLEAVFNAVKDYGEPDVLDVHMRINERGIAFDRKFLEQFYAVWVESEAKSADKLSLLTNGALNASNVRSGPQVKKYLLKECGFQLDTLNRESLERLYADPENFFGDIEIDSERIQHGIEVLKLRQASNRASKAKLSKIFELGQSDERIRDLLVYYGAHTGRFSGRGLQPHNFARGNSDIDIQRVFDDFSNGDLRLAGLEEAAARAKCSIDDVLATLVRTIFRAAPGSELGIADYGAIEARGTAWVAEESRMLETFADLGKCVYCDTASALFRRQIVKKRDKAERHVGKQIVLGCGYSMSAIKFGKQCKRFGVDLEKAGVTAEQCVETYRDTYPSIAGVKQGQWRRGGIWKEYHNAAFRALKDGKALAGKCIFRREFGNLTIQLPSGRKLVYREAMIEEVVPPYCEMLGLPLEKKPAVMYRHVHGYRKSLYGGLTTENIVQAISRDILCTALIRLEEAGYPVVLHVHDEILTEFLKQQRWQALRDMLKIMSEAPPWAKGFPILVEGFTNERYTKAAFSNSLQGVGLLGEIVEWKE